MKTHEDLKHMTPTPRTIANLQLKAYNNRDLDGFCELFDENACLTDLSSKKIIARGIDEIRSIYAQRFSIKNLRCVVHSTSDIGDFAVDKETVYGITDNPTNILAIYQVKSGKIHHVYFIRDGQ